MNHSILSGVDTTCTSTDSKIVKKIKRPRSGKQISGFKTGQSWPSICLGQVVEASIMTGVGILAGRRFAQFCWSVTSTAAFCQPKGGMQSDPVFNFWQPGPLLNAIGLFLTTCFVLANGRLSLWPTVWVLVSWCHAERYWSVPNYLPCFSQWEASNMTCVWVLSAWCPAELYWPVPNYLPCFSQWEASTMTLCLRSGSPVPRMNAIGLFLTTCFCFSQWEAPTMTLCLRSGSPVPLWMLLVCS